jgi:putative salt-induced outer membrane protein YdiY
VKTDLSVYLKSQNGEIVEKVYDSAEDGIWLTLWSGEHDPDIFINRWKRQVSIDMHQKNGNSDEERLSGGMKVKYIRENDVSTVYGKFNDKTRGTRKSADDRQFGADYELLLGEDKRHSWYARSEWLKDKIDDLKLRSTYATGYGYYFLKNKEITLRARSGLQFREEQFYHDETEQDIGLDFGLGYEQQFFEKLKWYTDVVYSPVVENLADYLFTHESGLSIPFGDDISLVLKSGVEHSYTTRPAEGFKELDTRYFMRLVFEF